MPIVRVDDVAAKELEEAVAWYEKETPGTGERLLSEFFNALSLLRQEPIPLAAVPGHAGRLGAKRLLLRRFPFDVIVVNEGGELVIIAVAHHSRRPGYWMDRLGT